MESRQKSVEERLREIEERLGIRAGQSEDSVSSEIKDGSLEQHMDDMPSKYRPAMAQVLNKLGDRQGTVILLAGAIRGEEGIASWCNCAVDSDWEEVASSKVASLMSPFANDERVKLARCLADKGGSSVGIAELEEESGLRGGQLYHHLREMAACGYLIKEGRNAYCLSTKGRSVLATILTICKGMDEWPHEQDVVAQPTDIESGEKK